MMNDRGRHSRGEGHDEYDQGLGGGVRVPVNITTGSMGRGGKRYEPLAPLHGQTRQVNVDMTWAEAIRSEFNYKPVLDATRYFVRQRWPSPAMHDLNTPISELLAEFKTEPEGPWKVTIIDNYGNQNLGISNTMRAQRREDAMKRQFPSEEVSQSPNKKRKVEQQQRNGAKVGAGSGAKFIFPKRNVAQPGPHNSFVNERIQPPAYLWVNEGSGEEDDVDKGFPSGLLDDDDETCSMLSQDSQDGEDLIRLGIADEDFKSKFLQTILKNLSGEMLLQVRAALQEQKATSSETSTSRDKWTKWALTCPYPVSILRTLFDV